MGATGEHVWLVTGCTSGLGAELVRQILSRNEKVIGAGRGAVNRCETLVNLGARIIDLDLAWDSKRIEDTIRDATSIYGGIDILVNNAGYCALDVFEELSRERLVESMNVNVFGTMSVTRAVFSLMREQQSGRIAIVGSMGGWDGGFNMTAYAVAKFALEGFTDALSKEGALFGIQAIVFEPGSIDTGMVDKACPDRAHRSPVYDAFHERGKKFRSTFAPPGDPAKSASRMIEVLTSTGVATGRSMPARLPLGSDALKMVRKKCHDTLKVCDDWEQVITSADKSSA